MTHASRTSDKGSETLCGWLGQTTAPRESVNCPQCRVILNHVRSQYPQHARYTDWRLTPEQEKKAARDLVADMHGGADD